MTAEPQETGEAAMENWEFTSPPTVGRTLELLATLPPVFDVSYGEFGDFVQPLGQNKKVDRRNDKGQKYVETVPVWHLYMAVAGRVKMLQRIADVNGWRVDFVPEKRTGTTDSGGRRPAGYLETEPRYVYREYVNIYFRNADKVWELMGSRPGTAQVPRSGGSGAAATNPNEKVETSARGRAIAAWGIGILPGSGIASLEEMQDAQRAQTRQEQQGNGGAVEGGQPIDRQNVLEAILTGYEEARMLRHYSPEESMEKMRKYVVDTLGVRDGWDEQSHTVRWGKVSPGQLAIMHGAVQEQLAKLRAQEAPL